MSELTMACDRGCTMYRNHVVECVDQDECRGCLPKRATRGRLCDTCARRFELMIFDAPTVIRWLTGNITGSGSTDPDLSMWAGDRPELGSDQRLPISADIFDHRNLIRDRLALWVDDWCEFKGLTGPDVHTPEVDSEYLLRWLPGLCALEWVGDWWAEMAETMSEAHALAPWRPAVKRLPAVPCPGCTETNLVIYGGETDVCCSSCHLMMTEDRFHIWAQVLHQEAAS